MARSFSAFSVLFFLLLGLPGPAFTAITAVLETAPALGTTNLLANPGFEAGEKTPDRWVFEQTTTGAVVSLSDKAFSGSRSAYISTDTREKQGSAYQGFGPPQPAGTVVMASCRAILTAGSAGMHLYGGYADTTGAKYWNRTFIFSADPLLLYPVYVAREDVLKDKSAKPGWGRYRVVSPSFAKRVQGMTLSCFIRNSSNPEGGICEAWFNDMYFGPPSVKLLMSLASDTSIARVLVSDEDGAVVADISDIASSRYAGSVDIPADLKYCTVTVTDTAGNSAKFVHGGQR